MKKAHEIIEKLKGEQPFVHTDTKAEEILPWDDQPEIEGNVLKLAPVKKDEPWLLKYGHGDVVLCKKTLNNVTWVTSVTIKKWGEKYMDIFYVHRHEAFCAWIDVAAFCQEHHEIGLVKYTN